MNSDQLGPIEQWLEILWDSKGTDLLLVDGSIPRIRVDGELTPLENVEALSGSEIDVMVQPLLTPEQRVVFKEQMDVDFAFSWLDRARLRGSVFTQKGQTALALRIIPTRIPSFEDLGLPAGVEWVAEQTRGFVLVTGPTGSGKSTTLASMINHMNATRASHILTIEDPIEYVHHHQMSAVTQREIGQDSPSFERALRSALREDPDVLLVGEMRDIESIQIALTMAETGHLVFGTLHTNDAPQAVDRVVDVFPAARQEQTRVQLAASLTAVIAQRLVPKIGGGMVAAFEVLIATNAVRNLIREGRSNQLANIMVTNSKEGMQTLESSLGKLVKDGIVSVDEAMKVAVQPKELTRILNQPVPVATTK